MIETQLVLALRKLEAVHVLAAGNWIGPTNAAIAPKNHGRSPRAAAASDHRTSKSRPRGLSWSRSGNRVAEG
jgi:lipid-binding SYLF domain-containing protein